MKSRYGDDRIFTIIDEDTIEISGKFDFMRAAYFEGTSDLYFIDFDGGPFIDVGGSFYLLQNKYEVISIQEKDQKIVLKVLKLE